MKADLPITRAQFFAAAEDHGLHVLRDVSLQKLEVASLEGGGPVLRIFAPVLRVLPDGTQINGSVGVTLAAAGLGSRVQYDEAMFHHILNLTELRNADRVIQRESDWHAFFQLLMPALEALPSTPDALADALADGTTWMGKQLSWRDANAVSFERRVRELARD